MTALSRPHFITPALMLALGLSACDRPAPQADTAAAPEPGAAATSAPVAPEPEPQAPPPPPPPPPPPSTPARPGAPTPVPPPAPAPTPAATHWDVSRTRDGATAVLTDSRGALMRIICASGPARLRVDVPGFRPTGRQDTLTLALGANQIPLAAGRGAGGVTATGALPPNIAARILRARDVSARYGRQLAGPFAPPRGADAMALANACEEAVSPAPPRPAPPLPAPGRQEQIPANFRGEWNARLADCGTGRNDSRLIIDARTVRFYESRGEVTGVTRNGPRAITVDARYTGEGRTWNRSTTMRLSGDGDQLTIDGAARQRCPAGDGRPGRRDNR
jgi:hypothetical protein